MLSIVYTSQVADDTGHDSALLEQIVKQSRNNNPAVGVTGAIIMRERRFLQVIEGETQPVTDLFAQIKSDSRHTDVKVIYRESIISRSFSDWSMQGLEIATPSSFDAQSIMAVQAILDQSFTYRGDIFLSMLRSLFLKPDFFDLVDRAA